MKFSAKAIAPIVVILVAVALYVGAISARSTPEPTEVIKTIPIVQVLTTLPTSEDLGQGKSVEGARSPRASGISAK